MKRNRYGDSDRATESIKEGIGDSCPNGAVIELEAFSSAAEDKSSYVWHMHC